ncbi:MAG: formylglycine-generating enzyme family protein [Treponema sp.]|nr:formylglycine-generating enzyme family protein [Treponema sp.]
MLFGNYAWYTTNSGSKTHETGKKTGNELGLKNMSRNVLEWCWDWYRSYPSGGQSGYTGGVSGSIQQPPRTTRAGTASSCAPASRSNYSPPAGTTLLVFALLAPEFRNRISGSG